MYRFGDEQRSILPLQENKKDEPIFLQTIQTNQSGRFERAFQEDQALIFSNIYEHRRPNRCEFQNGLARSL